MSPSCNPVLPAHQDTSPSFITTSAISLHRLFPSSICAHTRPRHRATTAAPSSLKSSWVLASKQIPHERVHSDLLSGPDLSTCLNPLGSGRFWVSGEVGTSGNGARPRWEHPRRALSLLSPSLDLQRMVPINFDQSAHPAHRSAVAFLLKSPRVFKKSTHGAL